MAWYTNSFGFDVFLNREDVERIKKRGDMSKFQPRLFRHTGTGPEKKIAIFFASHNGSNGIGDYVHMMPALTEKVKQGSECHVFTTEFFRPFVEWCGAVYEDAAALHVGSIGELMREYGEAYSLVHWCIAHDELTFGDVTTPRFQQIADLIGVELPDKYAWPFPKTGRCSNGPIALAIQSTSRERSYTHVTELGTLIDYEFGEAVVLGGGNAHKEEWMRTAATAEELIELISRCRAVVTVDNGILALALAMEIPTVAIFGPTQEKIIVEQYARYVSMENACVVRSAERNGECERPCNLQVERGYGRNQKCTADRSQMVDCMREIQPREIISQLKELLAHA